MSEKRRFRARRQAVALRPTPQVAAPVPRSTLLLSRPFIRLQGFRTTGVSSAELLTSWCPRYPTRGFRDSDGPQIQMRAASAVVLDGERADATTATGTVASAGASSSDSNFPTLQWWCLWWLLWHGRTTIFVRPTV